MNQIQLFLPCAGGVEPYLLAEVQRMGCPEATQLKGGVLVNGAWRDALTLNLHSRLASRVLVQLQRSEYRHEQDLYEAAMNVAWEAWFTVRDSFKVEITAQKSPLRSLNFAALKIKDAICDRFRTKAGSRPNVEVKYPDVRVYVHLTNDRVALYIDTSGEPLFKRGWREDKGDAPLKETLAAAMIAASGWDAAAENPVPLYDPCCGSGTVCIEAAQMLAGIAPGAQRRFGFEKLAPYQAHVWNAIKNIANEQANTPAQGQKGLNKQENLLIFGSDVAHRMVDFAQRNAQRAGVAKYIEFRGGDALQRRPPADTPGLMLLNPPYGERIETGGVARGAGREMAQVDGGDADDFFVRLGQHWKANFKGWSACVLSPDMKLPGRMRFKESARTPLWNGPIECRLFRFELR
jgi:putative N6-adenine-specific DNA methylase